MTAAERERRTGGRWMVVTFGLVSRHRGLREARATARHWADLGARVRRWRRDRVWLDPEAALFWAP